MGVVFVRGWGLLCNNARWWAWRQSWIKILTSDPGSSTFLQSPGCFDCLAKVPLLVGCLSDYRLAWCVWEVEFSRCRIARFGCIVSLAIWKNIFKEIYMRRQCIRWLTNFCRLVLFIIHSTFYAMILELYRVGRRVASPTSTSWMLTTCDLTIKHSKALADWFIVSVVLRFQKLVLRRRTDISTFTFLFGWQSNIANFWAHNLWRVTASVTLK